ncbi:radical SAM/SPASM domain-containing protein [Aeromonas veronii]|uniref:radical SAM protein n=1 Tax=Aeromonas veronii TaxID=654 RepID=UPI0002806893|nr:radical SAM protein [Aeromonas veronii]EKB13390.1 radical SAM additional 4Fe4S-binding domain-containing protein [Aeromonas veronii AER397]MBS4690279.1 radical SAM protein [Aeromonas veronii bv. veronii]OKP39700.1 aldehyde:ferredoxin oxidoreductase [Aeromonas veronii bv. veronii]
MYELGSPLLLVIEVTDKCNLKCVYCYNEFSEKRQKDIDHNSLMRILLEAKKIGVFDINFCGGEPFSNRNFMSYLELAVELGFDVTINTNGTLINDKISKRLMELDLIQHIQVSFDGHTEDLNNKTRGKFPRAYRGFQLLCQEAACRTLSPSVGIVLSKTNYRHLEEIISHFSTYTNRIHVMNVMGHENLMLDDMDKFILEKEIIPSIKTICKKTNTQVTKIHKSQTCNDFLFKKAHVDCLAGHTFLAISSNLDIFPCDIHRKSIYKWASDGDIMIAHKKALEEWRSMNKPWCFHDKKCRSCHGI